MTAPLFEPHKSFRIDRRFAAPIDTLWNAWTHPQVFARWVWAGIGENPEATIDLRPGGLFSAYTTVEQSEEWPSDRVGMWGIYLDIVPREKLTYTLHWDAPVGYNQGDGAYLDEAVSVTFTAAGSETDVAFDHFGIPDDGVSAGTHEHGERHALALLAKLIEG